MKANNLERSTKKQKIDLPLSLTDHFFENNNVSFKSTTAENLNVRYSENFLPKWLADELLARMEQDIEYYDKELSKIKIFGKWHYIPRQQVAYGEEGLTYKFSGVTVPAKPWVEPLKTIKDVVSKITNCDYNFVLINRYKDGNDHIGEHKDDEVDLDRSAPIASISLGQKRPFVFKHSDCRKQGKLKREVPKIKMDLCHGSLLVMEFPTNKFWYHSLPKSAKSTEVRVNLTFRKINNNN